MLKRILLLTLSLVLAMAHLCFAEVQDLEGITVHFTEEEWAAFIAAQEKEKEEHYNTKEVIDLIRSGAFTGVLVAGYSDSPGEMIWYKCARKDSFGSRSPYNPFLEGFWVTDFCISGKHNPWYNPKYNPDYYLYGITKAQFDALPMEEQVHQIYLNGPAYINCILDATANANAMPTTGVSSSNTSGVKRVTEYPDNYTIEEMQTITFGNYYKSNSSSKEPIEWIVLEKQNGKALVMSKYILDAKSYNDENKEVTWENSSLRKWLNSDFYNNAFNDSEKQKIINTLVENKTNEKYGTSGGNNTNDNVFCLSVDDVKKYLNVTYTDVDNKKAATKGTDYAKQITKNGKKMNVSMDGGWNNGNSNYWLRSPAAFLYTAACMGNNGHLVGYNVSFFYGVRPVMWINY